MLNTDNSQSNTKIKNRAFEKEIPDDVIEYIASNMGTDVRQLEGAITRLIAYSAIMGGEKITLDLAIEALRDLTPEQRDEIVREFSGKILSSHFIKLDEIEDMP